MKDQRCQQLTFYPVLSISAWSFLNTSTTQAGFTCLLVADLQSRAEPISPTLAGGPISFWALVSSSAKWVKAISPTPLGLL